MQIMNKKDKRNLTKKSVALKYDKSEFAPKIIAKGRDLYSKKLLEIAQTNDVPIIRDNELADNLYQIDINEFIPDEFFEIIATIYSFILKKKEIKDEEKD